METTIKPTKNTAWVNTSMKEGTARYIDQEAYDKCINSTSIFALQKSLKKVFVPYEKPIKTIAVPQQETTQ